MNLTKRPPQTTCFSSRMQYTWRNAPHGTRTQVHTAEIPSQNRNVFSVWWNWVRSQGETLLLAAWQCRSPLHDTRTSHIQCFHCSANPSTSQPSHVSMHVLNRHNTYASTSRHKRCVMHEPQRNRHSLLENSRSFQRPQIAYIYNAAYLRNICESRKVCAVIVVRTADVMLSTTKVTAGQTFVPYTSMIVMFHFFCTKLRYRIYLTFFVFVLGFLLFFWINCNVEQIHFANPLYLPNDCYMAQQTSKSTQIYNWYASAHIVDFPLVSMDAFGDKW